MKGRVKLKPFGHLVLTVAECLDFAERFRSIGGDNSEIEQIIYGQNMLRKRQTVKRQGHIVKWQCVNYAVSTECFGNLPRFVK